MSEQHGVVMSTSASGRGNARLRLVGLLDDLAVDRLRALLDDVATPGAQVRVDLSRAGTLPLAVLRALAATHRRLADGAGGLRVVDPSAAAARSLRTSGLHRALTVERWPVERRPVVAASDEVAVS